ncbi:MAG TPA: DUF2625 family protein [Micromonospora sp.]|nr:DUF2625 family protein [Micromonospora sp.]
MSEPAWPQIGILIGRSPSPVLVLPGDLSRRDAALEALQVSTSSFLGALVGECGALVVDHGWLRILGAGADGLPGVHEVNLLAGGPPPLLEVAWDAIGGRFAINGGGLDASPGEVCYWGPDTLDWTPIGAGHSAFVAWALSGAMADFYTSLRWPGWERETEVLSPAEGLCLWPPPCASEGRDPAKVSRSAVPMTELHGVYADLAQQLREAPDGSAFTLEVTE